MTMSDDGDAELDRALRKLPRAAPDEAFYRRVHQLGREAVGQAPEAGGSTRPWRRRWQRVARPLLALSVTLVVASYFGWSVCFLLASRMARPG